MDTVLVLCSVLRTRRIQIALASRLFRTLQSSLHDSPIPRLFRFIQLIPFTELIFPRQSQRHRNPKRYQSHYKHPWFNEAQDGATDSRYYDQQRIFGISIGHFEIPLFLYCCLIVWNDTSAHCIFPTTLHQVKKLSTNKMATNKWDPIHFLYHYGLPTATFKDTPARIHFVMVEFSRDSLGESWMSVWYLFLQMASSFRLSNPGRKSTYCPECNTAGDINWGSHLGSANLRPM